MAERRRGLAWGRERRCRRNVEDVVEVAEAVEEEAVAEDGVAVPALVRQGEDGRVHEHGDGGGRGKGGVRDCGHGGEEGGCAEEGEDEPVGAFAGDLEVEVGKNPHHEGKEVGVEAGNDVGDVSLTVVVDVVVGAVVDAGGVDFRRATAALAGATEPRKVHRAESEHARRTEDAGGDDKLS